MWFFPFWVPLMFSLNESSVQHPFWSKMEKYCLAITFPEYPESLAVTLMPTGAAVQSWSFPSLLLIATCSLEGCVLIHVYYYLNKSIRTQIHLDQRAGECKPAALVLCRMQASRIWSWDMNAGMEEAELLSFSSHCGLWMNTQQMFGVCFCFSWRKWNGWN